MAERARDALHCSGDIVITVTGECNIGIKKVAGYYNIELGVMLAGIESEDELFAMFLHEFAHMKEEEQDGSGIEYEYRNWLLYGMVESNLQSNNRVDCFFIRILAISANLNCMSMLVR